MTWTPKTSMLLDIDKPARSKDINAIFDNSEAMANGDSGAPKIQQLALDSSIKFLGVPSAGTTFVQKSMGGVSNADSSGSPSVITAFGETTVLLGTVMVGGTMTLSFTATTAAAGTPPTTQENGVLIYAIRGSGVVLLTDIFVAKGDSSVPYTGDFTALKGDVIMVVPRAHIMNAVSGGITTISTLINSGNDVVCIA